MPRDPITFSKGDSIPPPLCSQGSLSLSHWAAFFHQASIGSIVNCQYLSYFRDKECNFKAFKLADDVLSSETIHVHQLDNGFGHGVLILRSRGNLSSFIEESLHYLFAGSPAIIANLWSITDKEITLFAKVILNSWTRDSVLHKCNKCISLTEIFICGKSNFPSRR
ncbi:separase-like [Phalaenopsis equestris]|uniref:separase-like n=1 Tax=Phalaenopsis equestris TaxID=78828 RepID=UPI0009E3F96D|nr:separase-like [Phalaenopsis equestris]